MIEYAIDLSKVPANDEIKQNLWPINSIDVGEKPSNHSFELGITKIKNKLTMILKVYNIDPKNLEALKAKEGVIVVCVDKKGQQSKNCVTFVIDLCSYSEFGFKDVKEKASIS